MSELIEVKTSELTGYALDWAVAKAIGYECGRIQGKSGTFGCNATRGVQYVIGILRGASLVEELNARFWRPTTDWAQGGLLLDKYCTALNQSDHGWWSHAGDRLGEGETAMIAICRATVAAKLGDVVQVPEELGVVK